MGRIKVLFCSFCLDRDQDQTSEHAFNQSVDVSHLATPHISSTNLAASLRPTSNPSPKSDIIKDNPQFQHQCPSPMANGSQASTPQLSTLELGSKQRDSFSRNPLSASTPNQHPLENNASQNLPTPPPARPSASPVNNLYISQQPQAQQSPQLLLQPSQIDNIQSQPQPSGSNHGPPSRELGQDIPNASRSNEQATKLSYDIISVREPLAKILAERQQLIAQQQRLNVGDHEYIEVYDERGSSCFYEEIAGSVTSSATYDQIGANSNHNYQALINAYSVSRRADAPNHESGGESSSRPILDQVDGSGENFYDVTQPRELLNGLTSDNNASNLNAPSTSYNSTTNDSPSGSNLQNTLILPISSDRNSLLSQSIPVYSVINKATRRNNSILRAPLQDVLPPRPPPKNLTLNNQSSTSAISPSEQHRPNNDSQGCSSFSQSGQNSFSEAGTSDKNAGNHSRLPQPPPRMSRHPMFNKTDRPLPLPELYDSSKNEGGNNNNNNSTTNRNSFQDDDLETINNGYELLGSNYDYDQIDAGYAKIREPNRYSGGSITSQFYSRHMLDNDGYESVQPIYSSPSNALVEPNYEAIGPSTASEIAAAAAAKLTAASQLSKTFDNQINL